MIESKGFSNFIGYLLLGVFISILIGNLIINNMVSMSCDYHLPLNKKPNLFIDAFYVLEGGMHPSPNKFNWMFWTALGIPLGSIIYRITLIVKTNKNSLNAIS